jgi:CRP/FNR family transcriptional regulator, cyclic AMP receptor protein
MKTLEPLLAEHPFFKNLEKSYLELIVGCASNVRFEPGQFIFRQGEEANQFYIVRQGKVAIEISPPSGDPIILQTISDGEILGWSWMIPPYHWQFDAQAVELTRAITLDGKCLRNKCQEDHTLGYELLTRLLPIIGKGLEATRIQLLDVYGNQSKR